MTKFIHEKSNVDLEKDKTLFEYADKVRMRIPTSCGRVGDCHECIVEIIEGENNLSEHNFVAPYKLIGAAALSVDNVITFFIELLANDASIIF